MKISSWLWDFCSTFDGESLVPVMPTSLFIPTIFLLIWPCICEVPFWSPYIAIDLTNTICGLLGSEFSSGLNL